MSYVINGGTTPFTTPPGPAGTGVFDMDFNEPISGMLSSATSSAIYMNGNIQPGT
jgi:hypothetical protein